MFKILILALFLCSYADDLTVGIVKDQFFKDKDNPSVLYKNILEKISHKLNIHYHIIYVDNEDILQEKVANNEIALGIPPHTNKILNVDNLTYSWPFFSVSFVNISDANFYDNFWIFINELISSGFLFQGIILIITILCVGIMFALFEYRDHAAFKSRSFIKRLGLGIYWSVGICTTVGSEIQPTSTAGRFLTSFYCLSSVMLISIVTGTFSSMMTMAQIQISKNISINDLEHYNVGVISGTEPELFLEVNKINTTAINSPEAALDFLDSNKKNSIVLTNIQSKIFLSDYTKKSYREHFIPGVMGYQSFIISKNSPYLDQINDIIMEMSLTEDYINLINGFMKLYT